MGVLEIYTLAIQYRLSQENRQPTRKSDPLNISAHQSRWTTTPLAVAKELIDNAIDACEEHQILPNITIIVDDNGIAVRDNGPGLPEEAIRDLTDFSSRISSKVAYVSPTRWTQGNALQTLISMPRVLDGNYLRGEIVGREMKRAVSARFCPHSPRNKRRLPEASD
jgi:hypothetical protein